MKNILFVVLILISFNSFSQKKNKPTNSLDEKLIQIYRSEEFKELDLIVSPEFYNSTNDTTISRIDFVQDSSANYNDLDIVFASIDIGESLKEDYVIGRIRNYQVSEFSVNIIIIKMHKDKSIVVENKAILFDDLVIPDPLREIKYAEYSIDTEISSFGDHWL